MQKLRLVAFLSRWLEQKKIRIQQLDEQRIDQFLADATKAACVGSARSGTHWPSCFRHLRRSRMIPDPQPAAGSEPDRSTAARLRAIPGPGARTQPGDLGQLSSRGAALSGSTPLASNPSTGSTRRRRRSTGLFFARSPPSAPSGCSSPPAPCAVFWAFFIYAANWRALWQRRCPPWLPGACRNCLSFWNPGRCSKSCSSCDRSSPCGRRDYAALLLLARLGLRAGEVVHLCLEDINWSERRGLDPGQKCSRGSPAAATRCGARPGRVFTEGPSRLLLLAVVFIRMKAPHVGFSSSVAVCDIVRRALLRARLQPGRKGAHLLRHSLATQMLRGGASLTQIGQILRHQLPQTTEIYAKVDLTALRAVAQPWPGGVR